MTNPNTNDDLDLDLTLVADEEVNLNKIPSYGDWLGRRIGYQHSVDPAEEKAPGILLGYDRLQYSGAEQDRGEYFWVMPIDVPSGEFLDPVSVARWTIFVPNAGKVEGPAELDDRTRAVLYRSVRDASEVRQQRVATQTQNRYLKDKIDKIVERAHQEAEERGWCDEFDEIMEELDLPRRERDYEVTIMVKMTVPVTMTYRARSASDAEDLGDQESADVIEDRIADYLSTETGNIEDWRVEDVDAI